MQWAVDDVHASLARLIGLGAAPYQPVIERGHGFNTAAVVDPFGNILGIMENPHYLEILERDRARRSPAAE
jgi:predicted enzyme related to lactoylglutathione lyase